MTEHCGRDEHPRVKRIWDDALLVAWEDAWRALGSQDEDQWRDRLDIVARIAVAGKHQDVADAALHVAERGPRERRDAMERLNVRILPSVETSRDIS